MVASQGHVATLLGLDSSEELLVIIPIPRMDAWTTSFSPFSLRQTSMEDRKPVARKRVFLPLLPPLLTPQMIYRLAVPWIPRRYD